MTSLSIRKLDDDPKRRLRDRAAEKNRPMQDEAREILSRALAKRLASEPPASGYKDRFADPWEWELHPPPPIRLPRIQSSCSPGNTSVDPFHPFTARGEPQGVRNGAGFGRRDTRTGARCRAGQLEGRGLRPRTHGEYCTP